MSDKLELPIEIELSASGQGRVLVGGKDISHKVYKVELVGQVDMPTEVVLHMRAVEVKVVGSAWVSHKMLTLDPDKLSPIYQAVSDEEVAA